MIMTSIHEMQEREIIDAAGALFSGTHSLPGIARPILQANTRYTQTQPCLQGR